MSMMIPGLVLFLGTHVFTTFRDRRARLVARLGEGRYKGLYSLVSALGLVLIVWGYSSAPFVPVWNPPVFTRHLALLLMPFAAVFLVAAYAPTGRIKRALRHPFLAAVKIWALAHLLANGDLASMILFASLLAYAVYDRISLKRHPRGAPVFGPASSRGDMVAILGGLALFAVIVLWLHPLLGPPVLP